MFRNGYCFASLASGSTTPDSGARIVLRAQIHPRLGSEDRRKGTDPFAVPYRLAFVGVGEWSTQGRRVDERGVCTRGEGRRRGDGRVRSDWVCSGQVSCGLSRFARAKPWDGGRGNILPGAWSLEGERGLLGNGDGGIAIDGCFLPRGLLRRGLLLSRLRI